MGQSNPSAGVRNFRVSYFRGPRYTVALELYWKSPQKEEFGYIPAAKLMRPEASPLLSRME